MDRGFHIDDVVTKDTIVQTVNMKRAGVTNDLICAVCLSSKYLFVARESGLLQFRH